MKNRIVLASASPRRKELLRLIFPEYEVCPSDAKEDVPKSVSNEMLPEYLARIKAFNISEMYPDALVLGADTVVLAGNKILGKPKTRDDALDMLQMLSGKTHNVITGCAIVHSGVVHSFSVTTDVEFYNLSLSQIEQYIATGEPFDKAGGYGIQSKGALFVKRIDGDYFNVVGLPVASLKRNIEKFAPQFL